ncbi:MAG: cytochrome c oxidase subunit 3 [Tepidisphaerales bacterium]
MSTASPATAAPGHEAHDAHGHAHPPHLAHHFDTPEQQFASGKLGMWAFLGTELLMFGGLFCAYAVYRANHPDVFLYAHHYLDAKWGAVNTAILIASSFTMAWAVRAAQLGQKGLLKLLLALTFLGGLGFMCIKYVEYKSKWEHHLFPGRFNAYNPQYVEGADARKAALEEALRYREKTVGQAPPPPPVQLERRGPGIVDPNADTADAAKIVPTFRQPVGLATVERQRKSDIEFTQLGSLSQSRVNTFFGVYFVMTGLHGLHVLVGMAIIAWLFLTSGRYSPEYYTPVDLGGLYWHLVDLIWIFLFPLLYLIH